MQIPIKIPGGPGQCPEWTIIDLQGGLETRNNVSLNGRFIGDLHFTHKVTHIIRAKLWGTEGTRGKLFHGFTCNVPVLIIGHHILYGKVCDLEKPFAVLTKKHSDTDIDSVPDQDNIDKQPTDTHYLVKAIIRRRLLFKTRPKPIIANVPKKL